MSLILNLKTVIKSLWIVKEGNNVQFRVVRVHEAVKMDNSVHVSFNLTICCRWLSECVPLPVPYLFLFCVLLLCAFCAKLSAICLLLFAQLKSEWEQPRGYPNYSLIFPLCTHTAATIHRPFQIFASRLFVKLVPLFCPRILHLVYHLFAQLWWLPCSLARVSVLLHVRLRQSNDHFVLIFDFLIYYRLSGNSSRHKFHNLVIRLVGLRESTAALLSHKTHHIFFIFPRGAPDYYWRFCVITDSGGGPQKDETLGEIGNLGLPSVSQ